MGFLSRFEGKMEDTFEGAADKMFDAPISPVQIAKKAEKQMRREKMVGAGKQYAPTLYTVLVNPDDDRSLFGFYPTLAGETETYLAAKASEQGLVMDGQPLVRFIVDEDLKHGKFDVIAEAVAAPIIVQLRNEEMQRYGLAAPDAGYAPAPAQPYGAPAPAYGGQPAYAAPAPAPAPAPAYAAPVPAQPFGAPAGVVGPGPGGYDEGFDDDDEYFANAPQVAMPDAYGAFDPYELGVQPVPEQKPPLPYVPENELDYSIDYGEYTFDSRDFDERRDGPSPLAGAAMGAAAAAGAVAGVSAAPAVAADTVVFAGGQQAATPVPAQRAVRARLVDTTNNRTYDLASARLLLGRESKNDIPVPDINASRTHAELRFEPQGVWVITDLGSTNGTFVNGREISSQPLAEGDRITIGMTNYVFTQA